MSISALAPRSRGRTKTRPASPGSQRLQQLAGEVGRMSTVYEEVNRNREAHQKRLTEMLEETVRNIKEAHFHMQHKAKHVMESSKSYTSKFQHDLSIVKEALHRDLEEATVKMEQSLDSLGLQMAAAKEALERQHAARLAQTETTLGPLRDGAASLSVALKEERKVRQLQEQQQEKMVMDQAEAFLRLLDDEKFKREQEVKAIAQWVEPEQQRVAKQQSHIEKEARSQADDIRASHQAMTAERIENQHSIVESIADFVYKFRVHLDHASGFSELESAVASAAPAGAP